MILFVAVLTSCGPKRDPNLTYFDKADEYNDYIIDEQKALFGKYDEFINQISYGEIEDIKKAHQDLITQSKSSVDKINKLADFKKNVEFRDRAKDLFGFFASASEKELKEMVDIFAKGADITDADITRVDEISTYMDDNQKKYNDALISAQEAFAKKFNLMLI